MLQYRHMRPLSNKLGKAGGRYTVRLFEDASLQSSCLLARPRLLTVLCTVLAVRHTVLAVRHTVLAVRHPVLAVPRFLKRPRLMLGCRIHCVIHCVIHNRLFHGYQLRVSAKMTAVLCCV